MLPALEDVAHALEAVAVGVALPFAGGPFGDDEERGALKEEDLVGVDGYAEGGQLGLDDAEVRDQVVDDGGPGFVEGLVPDGGGEELHVEVDVGDGCCRGGELGCC